MLKQTQIGYAGSAPEMRYLPTSGDAVANVGVATSDHWTDKNSGEKKERTTWVNYEIYGKSAENFAKFVKKGSQLYIESTLRNHSWVDEATGETRYRDRHVITYWKLLDRKDSEAPVEGGGSGGGDYDDVPPIMG